MFDSVLQHRKVARQRALGGAVSFVVHGALIGGILWYGMHKPKAEVGPHTVPVAFLAPHPNAPAAPAAAPPPPPPAAPKHHKPKPHVIKPPLVIPKEIPKVKPPEKPPDPQPQDDDDDSDDDSSDDNAGGVQGGVAGGVQGGQVGGSLGAGGGDQPVFFGDGMTKPVMDTDASEGFHWTRAQLDARVEGLCLAQCIITTDGTLKDCKILKRIPMVEDAQIMDYLAHLKFHPALQGGKPISLKGFTIPLRLKAE